MRRKGPRTTAVAAGTTTTYAAADMGLNWPDCIQTTLGCKSDATTGTIDVSVIIEGDDVAVSMGTLTMGAIIPIVINASGVEQVIFTPTSLDDTYDPYVNGHDQQVGGTWIRT
jgi:hypothetical protein